MPFLKKKKVSFDLYKYKLENFDDFVSFDNAINNSSVSLVCSFSTEEEFKGIKDCLFGNYVFLRRSDNKSFLYSRSNKYRPFKKVSLFKQETVKLKDIKFPIFKEECKGKVRCVISKKKRNIEIIDEFGKNVNLLMPEVVDAVKKICCDSLMCEGRIGYLGPEKVDFFDNTGSFFVAVSDIFYINGRDLSEESFIYRKHQFDKLKGFSEHIFLNEHDTINYAEELTTGQFRTPGAKYTEHSSFLFEKGGS